MFTTVESYRTYWNAKGVVIDSARATELYQKLGELVVSDPMFAEKLRNPVWQKGALMFAEAWAELFKHATPVVMDYLLDTVGILSAMHIVDTLVADIQDVPTYGLLEFVLAMFTALMSEAYETKAKLAEYESGAKKAIEFNKVVSEIDREKLFN